MRNKLIKALGALALTIDIVGCSSQRIISWGDRAFHPADHTCVGMGKRVFEDPIAGREDAENAAIADYLARCGPMNNPVHLFYDGDIAYVYAPSDFRGERLK
jgi:hypothetical protein